MYKITKEYKISRPGQCKRVVIVIETLELETETFDFQCETRSKRWENASRDRDYVPGLSEMTQISARDSEMLSTVIKDTLLHNRPQLSHIASKGNLRLSQ